MLLTNAFASHTNQTQTSSLSTVATRTKSASHTMVHFCYDCRAVCQEKRQLRDFELEKVSGAATTSISGVSTLHPPGRQSIALMLCCVGQSPRVLGCNRYADRFEYLRQRDRRFPAADLTVFRLFFLSLLDFYGQFLMQVD